MIQLNQIRCPSVNGDLWYYYLFLQMVCILRMGRPVAKRTCRTKFIALQVAHSGAAMI